MKKIRMGVIGLGQIAQGVHLPGIARSDDLVLQAVCDIDEGVLQKIGEQYQVPEQYRFKDYRQLIRCAEVDAVDICTPNDCHFDMAMDAARAAKPYAVEKPVTMTAEQAQTLDTLTEKMKIKNMVCFSYRFKTAARYARELVQTGMLGDIYHVDMQYFQAWGLPDAAAPLFWRYQKARTGSGALGDLGCHALDLVRFVLGKEYTKVCADADIYVTKRKLLDGSGEGTADVDDYFNFLARMQDGVSASFQITRFAFGRGNYQRMEIYGSRGALVYQLDASPGEDELELCVGQPLGQLNHFTKVPLPQRFEADQMQSFADRLLEKEDHTAATMEDGLANQKVLDALLHAQEKEKWVALT